jgi:predicted nuclease of restriction endonuclease-like (RecB) superfamily
MELSKNSLLEDIKGLIDQSKQRVAMSVNAEMSLLFWHIGKRINQDILQDQRAEYGKQIIKTLSNELTLVYGNSFNRVNLLHFIKFSEVFDDFQIVNSLSRQFTWTHLRILIYLKDDLQRQFYMEMCRLERWSVRALQGKVNSMLFERTAISRKPEETIKQELAQFEKSEILTPDLVFRDPLLLDFLNLKNTYSEKDLETAILAELQSFITEIGTDFAFLARQKRITIDNTDYYIDLLFYHRRLRRLVVIDLKLGGFKAAYKGQMELYLKWLKKYESVEGENPPIGLILCAEKNQEHLELLEIDQSDIRVAEYITKQIPKDILHQKLQNAIEMARNQPSHEDVTMN